MADPSKTEKATPRRRSELRRKGQVAKSQELNTAVLFILAIVFLRFYLPFVNSFIQTSTAQLWGRFPRELQPQDLLSIMWDVLWGTIVVMLPFFGVLALAGILVNLVQVGWSVSWAPLKPELTKLNPVQGFKRLFSLQPLVQLGLNLVKISILVLLAWQVLDSHYNQLLQTVQMELGTTGQLLGSIVWELCWKIGLLMLVIAIADVSWQRWYFERNIRMSKQEVKDEQKSQEGDPQIKGRIRQLQRKAALNRMMEAIPRADVVLTNPVHLAVALAYAPDMNAPQVLAKGAAAVAERIKERAREHEVPVIENKPLARALFRNAEVGEEIPADLYAAVSEVLIYVYQLSGRLDDYLEQ